MKGTRICLAVVACLGASGANAGQTVAPSSEVCETRANDTPAKLQECIQGAALWRHLAAFQKIADENPGAGGHPNRNTGSSGYKASVDYVAALMRRAGYRVAVQPYKWTKFDVTAPPVFEGAGKTYALSRDWFVARLSGSGAVTAPVQPVGDGRAAATNDSATGCSPGDFRGFGRGHIALVRPGSCDFDTQVANAEAAGAVAIIISNNPGTAKEPARGARRDGGAFEARLFNPARIPVVGVASAALGAELTESYRTGPAPAVHLDIRTRQKSDIDYNLIADSPLGDPKHVVVVDAHLDSIYGAGMLDNASGSTTILEIALKLAQTPTRNRLRYIWFGGEELGLLGSHYYTRTLSPKELHRIAFDLDVDVTATPNFAILIADPGHAHNVKRFPPNVVPQSRIGNRDFGRYFQSVGIVSQNASFGNDGTDSNSFSLVGVPNSGILTQQDCCKPQWQVDLWGGFLGDYEGKVPGRHEACVDRPHRWCDNLSNNDRFVVEFVTRAVAEVTRELADDASLGGAREDWSRTPPNVRERS